jgi:hypothetical protein
LILWASCTPFWAGHHRCPEFAPLEVGGRQLWVGAPFFGPILRRICISGTHDRPIFNNAATH